MPMHEIDYAEENKHAHIKSDSISVPKDIRSPLLAALDGSCMQPCFSFRTFWAFTGPGLLMSIAMLDPGNLESSLQAGAVSGYQLLWVLWWSTSIALLFQVLATRVGIVNGRHLAQVCRAMYSPATRYALWIMMEIAIIASDVQEVIGSAIAINFLSDGKVPLWAGSLITAIDTFTFLLLEAAGLRKLEALFAILIATMSFSFGYIYVMSDPNQGDVMEGMIAFNCDKDSVLPAVGIVGAVIMPHNVYLHSALVVSRRINRHSHAAVSEANKYNAIDSSVALLLSFVINLFVLASFAEAFFQNPDIDTSDIDLLSSGKYLAEHFGNSFKYIWAIGLLAAGQSSTMTGTYAGQFVMEGFLSLKIRPWKRVAITRTAAMLPTLMVALFSTNAILNQLNEWMNVLQSFQLPFALLPLVHFASMPGIMGQFVLKGSLRWIAWLLCLGLIAVNYVLLASTLTSVPKDWYITFMIVLVVSAYSLFVLWIAVGPWLPFWSQSDFYDRELVVVRGHMHDGGEDEQLEDAVFDDDDDAPLLGLQA